MRVRPESKGRCPNVGFLLHYCLQRWASIETQNRVKVDLRTHQTHAGLKLEQRKRNWPNIQTTLGERLAFSGW